MKRGKMEKQEIKPEYDHFFQTNKFPCRAQKKKSWFTPDGLSHVSEGVSSLKA